MGGAKHGGDTGTACWALALALAPRPEWMWPHYLKKQGAGTLRGSCLTAQTVSGECSIGVGPWVMATEGPAPGPGIERERGRGTRREGEGEGGGGGRGRGQLIKGTHGSLGKWHL